MFLDKGVPRHHLLELQPQITTDLFLAKPGDAVGLQAFCQPGLTSSYSAPWSKTSPKSTPKYHTPVVDPKVQEVVCAEPGLLHHPKHASVYKV